MCECATGMGQRTRALARPGWPRLAVVSILTDYWLNWTLSPEGSEGAGSRVRGGTTLKKCTELLTWVILDLHIHHKVHDGEKIKIQGESTT